MNNKNDKNEEKKKLYLIIIICVLLVIIFGTLIYGIFNPKNKEQQDVAYTDLIKQVSEGNVKKVEMVTGSSSIKVTLKNKIEETNPNEDNTNVTTDNEDKNENKPIFGFIKGEEKDQEL